MQLLGELQIEQNTLLIFTSDNGPHQEGGHLPEFFDSNGPLRGRKRDLYEGGIRVPTIAYWPGTIKAGSTTEHLSAFWDFLPTACDIAGMKTPPDLDGVSYLPTLLGRPGEQKTHEYLYWEFYEQGGKRAVRMGNWKAVQLNVSKHPNGSVALFDLVDDLGERKNIALQQPEIVQRARRIFGQAHASSRLWSF